MLLPGRAGGAFRKLLMGLRTRYPLMSSHSILTAEFKSNFDFIEAGEESSDTK